MPRVSVIMIFFNALRFMNEAIESVFAQSFDEWELLLVDDGSTDGSSALAQRWAAHHPSRVRYLEHPGHVNRGTGAARSLGVSEARGEYIAFLDADDVFTPEQLAEQVHLLDAYPEAAGVYGRTTYWNSWTEAPSDAGRDWVTRLNAGLDRVARPPELLPSLLTDESLFFCMCSVMVRAVALTRAGGFDAAFRDTYEDMVFHAHLLMSEPVYVSSNVWGRYRRHDASTWSVTMRRARIRSCNPARGIVEQWLERNLPEPAYRSDPAYRAFLEALEAGLRTRGLDCGRAWEMVEEELWPLRHPTRHRLDELKAYASDQATVWRGDLTSGRAVRRLARRVVPGPVRARVRRRVGGRGGVVLVYHRVAEPEADPWALAVSPLHFAQHLDVMHEIAQPMALRALIDAAGDGEAGGKVAVTFDDGYADNLHVALPMLERRGTPATMFIVPGAVGNGRGFWWDALARLVLLSAELPSAVQIDLDGHLMTWQLGEAGRLPREQQARYRGWVGWEGDPPTARHAMFLDLWETMQPLSPAAREAVLEQLRGIAGEARPGADLDRILNEPELRTLAAHPLVTIGAHTVSHPQLSSISASDQRMEIGESKRLLEVILGRPVDQFAYPFGGPEDYGAETPVFVQEAGFSLACTTQSGQLRRRTSAFELPRYYVQDWDGAEFSRRLSAWLDR